MLYITVCIVWRVTAVWCESVALLQPVQSGNTAPVIRLAALFSPYSDHIRRCRVEEVCGCVCVLEANSCITIRKYRLLIGFTGLQLTQLLSPFLSSFYYESGIKSNFTFYVIKQREMSSPLIYSYYVILRVLCIKEATENISNTNITEWLYEYYKNTNEQQYSDFFRSCCCNLFGNTDSLQCIFCTTISIFPTCHETYNLLSLSVFFLFYFSETCWRDDLGGEQQLTSELLHRQPGFICSI